jgi:hypothetical protein
MADVEEVSRPRHAGRRVVAVGTVLGLLLGLALRSTRRARKGRSPTPTPGRPR